MPDRRDDYRAALRPADCVAQVLRLIRPAFGVLRFVGTACDKLVVLHQGRVLASGEVTWVLENSGARDVNTAFMRLTGAKSGSLAP